MISVFRLQVNKDYQQYPQDLKENVRMPAPNLGCADLHEAGVDLSLVSGIPALPPLTKKYDVV